MDPNAIFDLLWKDYSEQNPSVRKIYDLFVNEGEEVVNDHIAFRTLDFNEMNIDAVARPFTTAGYAAKGEYHFRDKHLFARHFEHQSDVMAPRVFISQLILEECSPFILDTFSDLVKKINPGKLASGELIFTGTLFSPL